KAHVAGAHAANNGVEVCAVVVEQPAGTVNAFGDFEDVLLKDATCVGIGQHDAGDRIVERRIEGSKVHATVVAGLHGSYFESGKRGAGGVGAVGAVGDKHDIAAMVFTQAVIGADDRHADIFALGAGGGSQGDFRHAEQGLQFLLQVPHRAQGALGVLVRLHGVQAGKRGHGG